MRNNEPFINVRNNLDIDDSKKRQDCPLLLTLTVPFTSYTISTLLYEIIKLSKEFPDSCIMDINNSQGSTSKIINIPK